MLTFRGDQSVPPVAPLHVGEDVDAHDLGLAPPREDVHGHHVAQHVQVAHQDLPEGANVDGEYVAVPGYIKYIKYRFSRLLISIRPVQKLNQ